MPFWYSYTLSHSSVTTHSLPVVSSGRDKDTPESRGFEETGAMKSWLNNLFTVNFRLFSAKKKNPKKQKQKQNPKKQQQTKNEPNKQKNKNKNKTTDVVPQIPACNTPFE